MDLSQGPKKNYRCDRSLQQFYTGGPFALGSAARGGEADAEAEAFLTCACGSELRVVFVADASAIGDPIDGHSEAITGIAPSLDSSSPPATAGSLRDMMVLLWPWHAMLLMDCLQPLEQTRRCACGMYMVDFAHIFLEVTQVL